MSNEQSTQGRSTSLPVSQSSPEIQKWLEGDGICDNLSHQFMNEASEVILHAMKSRLTENPDVYLDMFKPGMEQAGLLKMIELKLLEPTNHPTGYCVNKEFWNRCRARMGVRLTEIGFHLS